MSVENLLSESEIFKAESYRVRGNYRRAMDMTRSVMDFPPDMLTDSSDSDKKIYLMQLGVYGLSTLNHANTAWHGDTVCERLQTARTALKEAYSKEAVVAASKALDTDTKGNPYDYDIEFARHKAKYFISCFQLTGNVTFLMTSIEIVNAAFNNESSSNVHALAMFERGCLIGDYRMEKEAFNEIVATSPDNNERNATVGARFAIDAFTSGRFKDAFDGFKVWVHAASSDHNTRSILPREIAKWATNGIRHEIWRLTGKGDGYTRDLEL